MEAAEDNAEDAHQAPEVEEILRRAHEDAYRDFPVAFGKAVSKRERDEQGHMGGGFVYAEFPFEALAASLSRIAELNDDKRTAEQRARGEAATQDEDSESDADEEQEGKQEVVVAEEEEEEKEAAKESGSGSGRRGTFYDFGSGMGKSVVAAAMLGGFERCVGIEQLEGLHNGAQEALKRWRAGETGGAGGDADGLGTAAAAAPVELVQGNMLDFDDIDVAANGGGSSADVLFWFNATFEKLDCAKLIPKLERAAAGAALIAVSQEVESFCFDLKHTAEHEFDFGPATVFVYVRNAAPAGQAEPFDAGGGGGGGAGEGAGEGEAV